MYFRLHSQQPVTTSQTDSSAQLPLTRPSPSTQYNNNNNGFRHFAMFVPPPPVVAPTVPVAPPVVKKPPVDEMVWGKPTWILFHTLVEKVEGDKFPEIRQGLLNVIYSICLNLPCPKCADHAKKHLDGINFNAIQTKEDLKKTLFDFHNYVNLRKHKDIFLYDNLEQYKRAIVKNVIYNFIVHFNQKTKNIRYLADELHREHITAELQKWFKNNIQYFD